MKILKLKLRGAIGIWKGLGKEEIEIDFTKHHSGLIALTGKNGSGKTTIMENLHPYRTMVSRSGSLQSHFYLKDSYRILEFEHGGDRYESKILIDALTGASEAYLLKNGKALNDGKLIGYDELIESILGSQELFFNSVFSGQKSKGIAELKPSERRKLFYELLNLDIYQKYLEKAKANLKENELKLSETEGKISALGGEQPLPESIDEEVKILETDRKMLEGAGVTVQKNLNENSKKIKEKVRLKAKYEKDKEKNDDITRELDAISEKIDEMTIKSNSRIKKLQSRISENREQIDKKKTLIEGTATIVEKLKAIDSDEKTIAEKTARKDSLNERIQILQTELDKTNEEIAKINEEGHALGVDKVNIAAEIDKRTEQIEKSEKNILFIDDVPCDDSIGSSCNFLKNAYQSKVEIPKLQEEVSRLRKDYDKIYAAMDEMLGKMSDKQADAEKIKKKIQTVKKEWDSLKSEIGSLDEKIKDKENLLEQKAEIDSAENDIKLLMAEKKHLKEMIDETRRSFDTQIKEFQKEAGRLTSGITPGIEKLISQCEGTINALELNEEELKRELEKISESKAELNMTIARLKEKKAEAELREKEVEKLRQEKAKIQTEIKDWTFLSKAFDKTGIPVLKLENSGVQITAIANELLSLFENQFRIVFETTKLTKDKKKLRETFDINVISGDDVVEISNLSGGQQVWVETALQLAISLLVREQGVKIETSFLDEKDGALDIDNAHLYLQMLQLAHQKSGVHHTFVITHRPELIDIIPQKIILRDGVIEQLM